MKHQGTIALFQYWHRLRNGRPAPNRTEIEPADIKSLLADTFILELDMRDEAVFRLAGTRLCAIYGRELKGFTFNSLWGRHDQKLVSKLACGALVGKNVSVISFQGMSRGGRTLEFELVLLPLEGAQENPRTLGILTPEAKPLLAWSRSDPGKPNNLGAGGGSRSRALVPQKPPRD